MWRCVIGRWQQKASRPQFQGSTRRCSSFGKRSFSSGVQCCSEGRRWYSAFPCRPASRCVFLECFTQALERFLCGCALPDSWVPLFVSVVVEKFIFTHGWGLEQRRLGFTAQTTSAKCGFSSCSNQMAFRRNTGFWLKTVEELSQIPVVCKSFCILLLILWQRCCFHLLEGWGRLVWHNLVLECQQRLNCNGVVNNRMKEVSEDGSSYWEPGAVWEEQDSGQL